MSVIAPDREDLWAPFFTTVTMSSDPSSAVDTSKVSSTNQTANDDTKVKVIVRLLPPKMTESAFLELVNGILKANNGELLYYYSGKIHKRANKPDTFSRAYLVFDNSTKAKEFHSEFQSSISVKITTPAMVQLAPYQGIDAAPKSDVSPHGVGTIEQDSLYQEFVQNIDNADEASMFNSMLDSLMDLRISDMPRKKKNRESAKRLPKQPLKKSDVSENPAKAAADRPKAKKKAKAAHDTNKVNGSNPASANADEAISEEQQDAKTETAVKETKKRKKQAAKGPEIKAPITVLTRSSREASVDLPSTDVSEKAVPIDIKSSLSPSPAPEESQSKKKGKKPKTKKSAEKHAEAKAGDESDTAQDPSQISGQVKPEPKPKSASKKRSKKPRHSGPSSESLSASPSLSPSSSPSVSRLGTPTTNGNTAPSTQQPAQSSDTSSTRHSDGDISKEASPKPQALKTKKPKAPKAPKTPRTPRKPKAGKEAAAPDSISNTSAETPANAPFKVAANLPSNLPSKVSSNSDSETAGASVNSESKPPMKKHPKSKPRAKVGSSAENQPKPSAD